MTCSKTKVNDDIPNFCCSIQVPVARHCRTTTSLRSIQGSRLLEQNGTHTFQRTRMKSKKPKSLENVSRWNSCTTRWTATGLFLLAATCLFHHDLLPLRGVTSFPLSATIYFRQRTRRPRAFFLSPEDAFDLERFQRRHHALLQARQQQQVPPHPSLEPLEVVQSVLTQLGSVPHFLEHDPLESRPHPGVQVLWEASTEDWRHTMAAMVGGGTSTAEGGTTDESRIVSALGRFLARPHQQFAILMGTENQDYRIDFPTDVMEWSEEEAWLECRLRDSQTNELLVVLGWTLNRQRQQEAWYIHSFDWQDFRNAYRPGIGREEWERICG